MTAFGAAQDFHVVELPDYNDWAPHTTCMSLTGFDAPALYTMHVDKPMRGHGLMQAIARVNRVFRDKPGELVVDCIGLAQEL